MSINSPAHDNAHYITAASLTTNVGQSTPFGIFCLDDDFLFQLSFPVPNPMFINFQGVLDGAAVATGIGIALPNLPALQCLPLHIQGIAIDLATSSVAFTNVLNFSID